MSNDFLLRVQNSMYLHWTSGGHIVGYTSIKNSRHRPLADEDTDPVLINKTDLDNTWLNLNLPSFQKQEYQSVLHHVFQSI